MHNTLLLSLLVLWPFLAGAQTTSTRNADQILVAGDRQAKVLLFGTFHFDYPGLDDHKTAEEDKVDVTAPEKAAELAELIEYLARFQPTKIVVEKRDGKKLNERYRSYLAGAFELPRGEEYQLGFRLAKRFGLDSLVAGDAKSLAYDLYVGPDSLRYRPWLDEEIYVGSEDENVDTLIDHRYGLLYENDDRVLREQTLMEYFRYVNSTDRIHRGHGHYLEYTADADPDALAIGWYSRNLRIYRKIQRATTSPDDRILVIFGSGHLGILRQQFESSPRYDLVDFGDL